MVDTLQKRILHSILPLLLSVTQTVRCNAIGLLLQTIWEANLRRTRSYMTKSYNLKSKSTQKIPSASQQKSSSCCRPELASRLFSCAEFELTPLSYKESQVRSPKRDIKNTFLTCFSFWKHKQAFLDSSCILSKGILNQGKVIFWSH